MTSATTRRIERAAFDVMPDGAPVERVTLRGERGFEASISRSARRCSRSRLATAQATARTSCSAMTILRLTSRAGSFSAQQ